MRLFTGLKVLLGSALLALFVVCTLWITPAKGATDTVTLSTSVQEYLAFSITGGSTISFGNLTPGTAICSDTATVASVTTNASNGYTIGLSDSVASTGSALRHTDGNTRIADYVGTIATPTAWTGTGLGVSLFAADTGKAAKWGTGATVCDANNKYAGVPQNATTAHTATGYHSGADTSSWSWKIDVPNTQKTGTYSGNVTFTATAALT